MRSWFKTLIWERWENEHGLFRRQRAVAERQRAQAWRRLFGSDDGD